MATTVHQHVGSVTDQIITLIQQRDLKIGDQLPSIRELAKLTDNNVNAVRDALLQAQTRGIVKVLPRAGAFVQKNTFPADDALLEKPSDLLGLLDDDEHNLFHLLDARKVLELELGARAVKRCQIEDLLPIRQVLEAMDRIPIDERRSNFAELDIQFHMQIAKLSGNPVLALVLESILKRIYPLLEQLPWDDERVVETDDLHGGLYQALIDGDEESFNEIMSVHQQAAYDRLVQLVRSSPVKKR